LPAPLKIKVEEKYGRLTVLGFAFVKKRERCYLCVCDCGTLRIVSGRNLVAGRTRSCGCFQRDRASAANLKHGYSETAVYEVWENMLQRCLNERHPNFRYYGGRGISVCYRWLTFENFLADMGDKPEGLEIDRIDNDGNYEPENCRWVDKPTQNRNRRGVHRIDNRYDG